MRHALNAMVGMLVGPTVLFFFGWASEHMKTGWAILLSTLYLLLACTLVAVACSWAWDTLGIYY